MARDPNEIKREGWLDAPDDFQGITPPEGVDKAKLGTEWYARERVFMNGRRVIEWYKRGSGGGAGGQGDAIFTSVEDTHPATKQAWEAAEAKGDQEGDIRPSSGPTREVFRGGKWVVEPNPVYNPPASAAAADPNSPAGRAAAANATEAETKAQEAVREAAERKKNRELPADQDPRDETDAQRAARADARIKQQGADAKDAETRERQRKIDEQNAATAAAAARRADAAESRAAATANRIPNPDVPGGFLEKGPDGTWRPIKTEGLPTGAEPAGAPRPSGRLGEAASDLESYDQWLAPQVRAGKMTPAQADKLREARRSFWDTAIKEQQGVVNTQSSVFGAQSTQRSATLSDLSNRRSNQTNIALNAGSGLESLATKLGGGPGAATGLSAAIENARISASNFATMSGANRMVPEVQMGPALTAVNQMPLPGGGMSSGFNPRGAAPVAPVFTPQSPVNVPTLPGAAPATATPSAPRPAAPAAGAPVSAAPAQPMLSPSVVQATTGTTHDLIDGLTSGQQPSVGAPDPGQTGDPSTLPPSINPSTGEPTGLAPLPENGQYPQQPEPTYADPTAGDPSYSQPQYQPPTYTVETGPPSAQSSVISPSPYFLAGSSRGHVYDPTPSVQALIDDPTMDNEHVRQAVAEMYPGYDIDRLLAGRAA